MAQYPPVNGVAYTFYTVLPSVANPGTFQVNPTLAAGDVQISKDGGALANLATLPVVAPAGSVHVKVVLSAAEMTADNLAIAFLDVAGNEWTPSVLPIQPWAAVPLVPTVAGRTLDVATTGEAGLDFDNIKNASGATVLTNITVPVVTAVTNDVGITQAGADKVWGTAARTLTAFGFSVAISAAAVQAIWDALTSALTTSGSIGKRLADFITGDAFARLGAPAGASVSADVAAVKVDTAAIKAKTDNLPADPADESNTQARFTTIDAALVVIDDFLDTEIAAIKAKTDNLPADPADESNVLAAIAAIPAAPTATANADALLNRDMAAVSDTNARSPLNAFRFLRNRWDTTTTPGSLTVRKENDTTVAWQSVLTADPTANPIVESDPT